MENKFRRAWINGNLISFKKPKYKSAFFDCEEVFVVKVKTTKSSLSLKQIKFLNKLLFKKPLKEGE